MCPHRTPPTLPRPPLLVTRLTDTPENICTTASETHATGRLMVTLPDVTAIIGSIETGRPLIHLAVVAGPLTRDSLQPLLRTQLCRAAFAGARGVEHDEAMAEPGGQPPCEAWALENFLSSLGLPFMARNQSPASFDSLLENEAITIRPDALAEHSDHFEAVIEWLGTHAGRVGREYSLTIAHQESTASISATHDIMNRPEASPNPSRSLEQGDLGVCTIATSRPLAIEKASSSTRGGRFVLRDRSTGAAVAIGLVRQNLQRATNIHRQSLSITRQDRERLSGTSGNVIWLTGLSGSGKSTIANALEQALFAAGRRTYILDGDNIRHGLNRDLGFSDADRVENIRRIAEVAKLMLDAGLIVITAFISPFRHDRQMARNLIGPGDFFEIHVSTPIDTCEQRDPKGLYRKARRGELPNLTGIGSPYEAPENPELTIDTSQTSIEQAVQMILARLDGNFK